MLNILCMTFGAFMIFNGINIYKENKFRKTDKFCGIGLVICGFGLIVTTIINII